MIRSNNNMSNSRYYTNNIKIIPICANLDEPPLKKKICEIEDCKNIQSPARECGLVTGDADNTTTNEDANVEQKRSLTSKNDDQELQISRNCCIKSTNTTSTVVQDNDFRNANNLGETCFNNPSKSITMLATKTKKIKIVKLLIKVTSSKKRLNSNLGDRNTVATSCPVTKTKQTIEITDNSCSSVRNNTEIDDSDPDLDFLNDFNVDELLDSLKKSNLTNHSKNSACSVQTEKSFSCHDNIKEHESNHSKISKNDGNISVSFNKSIFSLKDTDMRSPCISLESQSPEEKSNALENTKTLNSTSKTFAAEQENCLTQDKNDDISISKSNYYNDIKTPKLLQNHIANTQSVFIKHDQKEISKNIFSVKDTDMRSPCIFSNNHIHGDTSKSLQNTKSNDLNNLTLNTVEIKHYSAKEESCLMQDNNDKEVSTSKPNVYNNTKTPELPKNHMVNTKSVFIKHDTDMRSPSTFLNNQFHREISETLTKVNDVANLNSKPVEIENHAAKDKICLTQDNNKDKVSISKPNINNDITTPELHKNHTVNCEDVSIEHNAQQKSSGINDLPEKNEKTGSCPFPRQSPVLVPSSSDLLIVRAGKPGVNYQTSIIIQSNAYKEKTITKISTVNPNKLKQGEESCFNINKSVTDNLTIKQDEKQLNKSVVSKEEKTEQAYNNTIIEDLSDPKSSSISIDQGIGTLELPNCSLETIDLTIDENTATHKTNDDSNKKDNTESFLGVDTNAHNKLRLENSDLQTRQTLCDEPEICVGQTLDIKYTVTDMIYLGKFSHLLKCEDRNKKNVTIRVTHNYNKSINIKARVRRQEKIQLRLQNSIFKDKLHCIQLLSSFPLKPSWCLVLEYFPMSLSQALARQGRGFQLDTVKRLTKQLFSALAVLKHERILHTDIKPAHIMINEKYDTIKLGGIDCAEFHDQVNLTPFIGTLFYRAPEIILGVYPNAGIDVWASACVVYEMSTGCQLFSGATNNEVLYHQLELLGVNNANGLIRKGKFSGAHLRPDHFLRRCQDASTKKEWVEKVYTFKGNMLKSKLISTYNAQNTSAAGAATGHIQSTNSEEQLMNLHTMLAAMLEIDPKMRSVPENATFLL